MSGHVGGERWIAAFDAVTGRVTDALNRPLSWEIPDWPLDSVRLGSGDADRHFDGSPEYGIHPRGGGHLEGYPLIAFVLDRGLRPSAIAGVAGGVRPTY